eukprot:GHVP01001221.1.p1 GENE.GHVP01001221.1~~GHVP01001221.1.p1  ORF type:complete len:266 (-),score=45.18 GHVP01001221.1:889-1686(-)
MKKIQSTPPDDIIDEIEGIAMKDRFTKEANLVQQDFVKKVSKREIPKFIKKLHYIIDKETENGISWCREGRAIEIYDKDRFESVFLPKYYKHKNINSFIKQLSIHDFKRMEDPSLYNTLVYENDFFRKDHPEYLCFIERSGIKKKDLNKSETLRPILSTLEEGQKELHREIRGLSEKMGKLERVLYKLGESNQKTTELLGRLLFTIQERVNPQPTKIINSNQKFIENQRPLLYQKTENNENSDIENESPCTKVQNAIQKKKERRQ